MKIAFDIGGVISKFPEQFRVLGLLCSASTPCQVYVITDMHDKEEVLKMLANNHFDFIPPENVYCADYKNHGEFCKAILLKQLGIDIFIDDFVGYVQWDSSLGPAPIRLLVAPDGFKPYWHDEWKVEGEYDFGRRVTSISQLENVDASSK
jgi:hypothetical protein